MATNFTPWTATQITAQLIQLIQAESTTVTDFTVGSVLRSAMVEPYAITAQALAQDIVAQADQTMQMTLQRALNVTPQPAQAAYGSVTFSVPTAPTSAVTLPQGFTVAVPGSALQFVLEAPVMWAAGTTSLSAVVTCQQAGSIGNVPANTVTQIVSAVPSGLTGLTVTNPLAFTTGANAQTTLDATAQVPAALAALKAATGDALAAKALSAVVQNSSGYVVEAVGAANSADGGYVPTPSVAPTLTAGSPSPATALASGTYTVGYTWTTAAGETPLSPTASITISAGQAINVAGLMLPSVTGSPPSPNATGINYYLSTAPGASTLGYVLSGTGDAVGVTALPASGAAGPPTVNTAFSVTPGFATVWIANDLGTAPSAALLTAAQQAVTGYVNANGQPVPGAQAAGIVTLVVAAQLVSQGVSVAVTLGPGYTLALVQTSVAQAITDYFAGLDIGQGISVNALVLAVTSVPGVTDASFTLPAANVAGQLGVLYVVGTISVSAAS